MAEPAGQTFGAGAPAILTRAIEAASAILGPLARRDWPLGPLTTYRVGGPAALFVEANERSDLAAVRKAVLATSVPVAIVGKGSNLLVADAGFAGLVVTLGRGFGAIEMDQGRARAGAATSLPVLARRTAAAGLSGFEWAVGVPGSLGGAVRMNAGGHGSDISRCLVGARVVDLAHGPGEDLGVEDLRIEDLGIEDLGYAYRHSALGPSQVVVEATLGLAAGDRERSEEVIAEIVRWRRAHQPGGQNAGSVFTNPPHDSAGRVVEAAGLRGHRLGSAAVSTKHANFIQADPQGRADDVRALIDQVRLVVRQRMGIDLVPEVRMLGFARDPAIRGQPQDRP